ncbi:amidophosphoribosyltransferase [Helicobacter sp. 12S02634-8]|uniref:ComF family protein n=1 Tax=Helicobacter sp. 12S02634-8 TaxID=1476199 RepID=UPI000BA70121|nr:phosphoribosyltransferase family protein [Helicobacter sp. 12S02634-8]PAF48147.1 amidophosphoribosyltransferase [Helicobacter sp. 12S02634-8]
MKCVLCARFYLKPICPQCLSQINITPSIRVIKGVSIYSFYRYSDIDMLLKSKYYVFGSRIFAMLSQKASDYFFSPTNPSLWKQSKLYGIGIDDCPRSYYSHTAIILKAFCRYGLKATYGALQAKNIVHYAGKSLRYRQQNPRNLTFKGDSSKDFFLVDDIITTGTTMAEAIDTLEKAGANVCFGIALCNAGH